MFASWVIWLFKYYKEKLDRLFLFPHFFSFFRGETPHSFHKIDFLSEVDKKRNLVVQIFSVNTWGYFM